MADRGGRGDPPHLLRSSHTLHNAPTLYNTPTPYTKPHTLYDAPAHYTTGGGCAGRGSGVISKSQWWGRGRLLAGWVVPGNVSASGFRYRA